MSELVRQPSLFNKKIYLLFVNNSLPITSKKLGRSCKFAMHVFVLCSVMFAIVIVVT